MIGWQSFDIATLFKAKFLVWYMKYEQKNLYMQTLGSVLEARIEKSALKSDILTFNHSALKYDSKSEEFKFYKIGTVDAEQAVKKLKRGDTKRLVNAKNRWWILK